MKRIISSIVIFIMSVNISACIDTDKRTKYPSDQAVDTGKTIITCFENKDKETLLSVFTEYEKTNHPHRLDVAMEEAFDFLDGEIVEYGEISGGARGGSHTVEDGWIERVGGGDIKDIKTEQGTVYRIRFDICFIDKKHEENVGVQYIRITNETMEETSENEEERVCEIGTNPL